MRILLFLVGLGAPLSLVLAGCFTDSPFVSTCEPSATSFSTTGGIRGCFHPDLTWPGNAASDSALSVSWNAATGVCERRPTDCGSFAACPGRCLVSCEVATSGFLALSLRAAVGVKSFDLVDSPSRSNGSVRGNWLHPLPDVFRADELDQLASLAPRLAFKEAVVSLLSGGSVVGNVTFDLSSSPHELGRTNWFSHARLKASWPVTDLKSRTFNFFSIQGDSSSDTRRRFFISYRYGGCEGDFAFMVSVEATDGCLWSYRNFTAAPNFLYTANPNVSLHLGAQVADWMTVVLR